MNIISFIIKIFKQYPSLLILNVLLMIILAGVQAFSLITLAPIVDILTKPDFIDVIQEPDIFIFDYPSTAFALAAATSKAIIYFDIGLRNLKPGALDSIKERCVYINGAAIDAQSLVLRAYQERDKQCKNTYTPRYSLSKNPREREHILIELIKEYAIA